MTLAPGSTIAPENVLLGDPRLPESWWRDLDTALTALAEYPVNMDHELGAVRYTINGVRAHFGVELPGIVFAGLEWTTAHADLHWGNLQRAGVVDPRLGKLAPSTSRLRRGDAVLQQPAALTNRTTVAGTARAWYAQGPGRSVVRHRPVPVGGRRRQ